MKSLTQILGIDLKFRHIISVKHYRNNEMNESEVQKEREMQQSVKQWFYKWVEIACSCVYVQRKVSRQIKHLECINWDRQNDLISKNFLIILK